MGDALATGNVRPAGAARRPAPFTLDPEGALASLASLEADRLPRCCPDTERRGAAGSQSQAGSFDMAFSVAPVDVGTGYGLFSPSGGYVYELGLVCESGAFGVRVGIAG